MYKDIINYSLAEDVSERHLLKLAKEIIDFWMSKQDGFISWEIHKNNNENYTDIVYWNSKEAAKNAEKEMMNIPKTIEWASCYKKGSISSQNLTQLAKF